MRISTIEFELSVPVSTGPGAPASSNLEIPVDGYIAGAYFACNAPPNIVYWRLSTQNGRLLVPFQTAAPVGAGVPAGWAAGMDKVNHPVEIRVYDDLLTFQALNLSATTVYSAYLQVLISDEGFNTVLANSVKKLGDILDLIGDKKINA